MSVDTPKVVLEDDGGKEPAPLGADEPFTVPCATATAEAVKARPQRPAPHRTDGRFPSCRREGRCERLGTGAGHLADGLQLFAG